MCVDLQAVEYIYSRQAEYVEHLPKNRPEKKNTASRKTARKNDSFSAVISEY